MAEHALPAAPHLVLLDNTGPYVQQRLIPFAHRVQIFQRTPSTQAMEILEIRKAVASAASQATGKTAIHARRATPPRAGWVCTEALARPRQTGSVSLAVRNPQARATYRLASRTT